MEYLPSYTDSIHADIQPSYTDSLTHHGIKGMHWGVRRYQNPDGSLTDAGKKRYAVKDSKGSIFGLSRTFGDKDIERANDIGGTKNRDSVQKECDNAIKNDKAVNAAKNDCLETTRACYEGYANLYNKHANALGVKQRFNPKTFNWYNQFNDIDSDVDAAVWDDRSKEARKWYQLQDRHENNVDRLIDAENKVIDRYTKRYNDAVLRDIPNDGSKQATSRILKKYGNRLSGLAFEEQFNSGNNYGWGTYNLFDA